MSIDQRPARLSERLATIALGTALVLLTVAVLTAMHVLGGMLEPPGQRADGAATGRVLDVPLPDLRVTGPAASPGTTAP